MPPAERVTVLESALVEASQALVEIGKGTDDPQRYATETLIRLAELVGSNAEPFRIALSVLDAQERR